jgi:hypothetical protein
VLSLLWCCLRCLMCGYACCTCCCGCCGGRRHKREQQYPPPPPPPPLINRQPAPLDEPKYAYFDVSDDALPHMPSLNQSETVRINIGESHEMGAIQKPSQSSPPLQQSGRMRSPSPARTGHAQEYYAHEDKAHLVRSSSAASYYPENEDHGHGVPQYGQHDAYNYGHEAYGRGQYQYQAHAYLTPAPQRTYGPNDRRGHEEWTVI